ncbi:YaaC family protein [Flavobacterium ginsenosidimutans]|uniref:YaaC family protein n=1 Tax=Flavobacterium ginsenosidimutans TaxID=687844 RepID=UPI003D96A2F9
MVEPKETQSSELRYIDLEKQIWREILTFSDIRILKEKLKKQSKISGEGMSDSYALQKAKDIQYCIKQAHEYFKSSKVASISIKPTLIYYAIINLAAAIIIIKKREKSLNSMREAHGLKDKIPDKLKNGDSGISRDDILLISAEFQDSGTFTELLGLDLSEYFILPIKHNSSSDTTKDFVQKINFSLINPDVRELNLSTLFSNIPEIWKENRLSLKKESKIYLGEAILNNENITCRISKELITIEEINKNFSLTENSTVAESNNNFFFTLPKNTYTTSTPLTKRDIIGNQYLTADRNNDVVAGDFILYYATFFILGSLSRYKPSLWRFMIEDSMHGLNTIPEILCDSAYIKMPLYFLMELDNNFYKI